MEEESKTESNNGWQNIGICYAMASEKIKPKYRDTYLQIIKYSFGYCQSKTNRYTLEEWSKKTNISKSTLIRHIKWLEDNEYIKIITYSDYTKGGGSKPNQYAPIFPYKIDKKYGHIKIDKEQDKKQDVKTKQLTNKELQNAW